MLYPASCLVYLFGDQFAAARRGPVGGAPLPWRRPAGVDARSLGQQILTAALVSLAAARRVILTPGARREDGLLLGVLLDTFRDGVLVSRGPEAPQADAGRVESKLLEQVEARTPLYHALKEAVPFGIEPWNVFIRLAQDDLVEREALRRITEARLGGLLRHEHLDLAIELSALEAEAAAVRREMGDFNTTYPALRDLLAADIDAVFRQGLERLW